MSGFFSGSKLATASPTSTIPKCGACGLYKTCLSPKMEVSGEGRRKILIFAEAPGAEEDKRGIQLIGKSGRLLEKVLRNLGCDMRRDCWLHNALICRPPNNAAPTEAQIGYCRPNLLKALQELKPYVVICLGGVAMSSILPLVYRSGESSGIATWAGWQIPSQKINAWICPTFHPAYILRTDEAGDTVSRLFFERHLAAALTLDYRPWENIPDWRKQVKLVLNPDQAAEVIRRHLDGCQLLAFDYETNCIKPDHPQARIVSCSVCFDGHTTIAFPWVGEVIAAMRDLLQSDVPKIASNLKFEERWTRAILGVRVRRWAWDTMLAAHILDNRPRITGLKFQSFVQLGMPCYNDHIEPFLVAEKGRKINRVHLIDVQDLLLYNGLDSLLEYKVAKLQMRDLGYAKG